MTFFTQESIKCFERALDISPLCIFAHWGIALCHGPNYNTKAMSRDNFPSGKEAYAHALRVSELLKGAMSITLFTCFFPNEGQI